VLFLDEAPEFSSQALDAAAPSHWKGAMSLIARMRGLWVRFPGAVS